jgi:outer membrane protein OmpA-like peptidoglycan-associated protein
MNVRLSFDRVSSCRDYIVSQGIDQGRILAKGYGPDKPIADNGTEEGRKLNRRVEMKLLAL